MTTEYKSVVRRESNVENTLRGGLKNGQWGLFANTSNNYVDGGINRNNGSIWALDQNSRFHEFLDRKTITTLISSAISAIPAPATSTPGGALTSIQYNNGGVLGGFGTFDGTNVNIGANNLITSGNIGTDFYADFVNKIYTRTIRLSNNETNSTESLLQIVNGDNTSALATAYISENRVSGLALNIYSSNPLNTGAALQVSSNAGSAITALSTSGNAIIALTTSGDYSIFASGGTSASIYAGNGVETSILNSRNTDLLLKRNNVLKATIADTLTTIHQALDVQGVGTFDSIVTDVGGITSAGDAKIAGRDFTIEGTGTLSGTSTTETIEMDELSTYLVSASMFGSNCEILLSAIVSNLTSNVIGDVSVLNSASFALGLVNIQRMNGLGVGSFSIGNGSKVQLIFNAVGVSGTTTWKWSAKRLH